MYRSIPLCTLQFPVDFVLWFKFTAMATVQGGIEMREGGGSAVRKN